MTAALGKRALNMSRHAPASALLALPAGPRRLRAPSAATPPTEPGRRTLEPKAAATDFLFSDPHKPMLFMLFDLGLSLVGPRTRRVQVMRSLVADGLPLPSRCAVWAIHARGHDAGMYGCVTALDTKSGGEAVLGRRGGVRP